VTLGDARDARVRDEARAIMRDRRIAINLAKMRLASANARYDEFGGSIRRMQRMKAAAHLRDLEANFTKAL
jgi:hypothetical protein